VVTHLDHAIAFVQCASRAFSLKLLACWSPAKYGNKATVDVGNKTGETLKVDSGVDSTALVATLAEAIRTQKADK